MKWRTQTAVSCYMNNPRYSKLFIHIVRETSVRETTVRKSDCPGNVRYPIICLVDKHSGLPTPTLLFHLQSNCQLLATERLLFPTDGHVSDIAVFVLKRDVKLQTAIMGGLLNDVMYADSLLTFQQQSYPSVNG